MSTLPYALREPRAETEPALEDGLKFRTIHGHRRAFIHAGSGPALLLIHGIGDSSRTFRHLVARLARRYTVVAPDLLGHGHSDKPRADYSVAGYANAMRDLISVLDIDRVTVVGHSLGGGVAMQFAYQYPDRCDRLVLVSSGGVSREVHPLLRLASAPLADLTLPLLEFEPTRVAVRAAFRVLKRFDADIGRDADDLLAVLFGALSDMTARQAFARTLRAVVDVRGQVVTMLDRCYLTRGMPTMLVWGRRDAVVPYEHALLAHAAMPGSRLETFPDAGHFPHHADPARFLAVLEDFLSTTAPSSYSDEHWRQLLRRGRSPDDGGPGRAWVDAWRSARSRSGT